MSLAGMANQGPAASDRPTGAHRATPLTARGEPMVWLTGVALAVCVLMVAALLGVVLYQGSLTFWSRPIERVTLTGGESFLAVAVREEPYEPAPEERKQIEAQHSAGTLPPGSLDSTGLPLRRLYRVGNKEFNPQPFRWVSLYQIASAAPEPGAVLLERTAWGVWLGKPAAIVRQRRVEIDGPADKVVSPVEMTIDGTARRVERTVVETLASGRLSANERWVETEGGEATWKRFNELHGPAVARREEMQRLETGAVGDVNARLEAERLRLREAELAFALAGNRAAGQESRGIGVGLRSLLTGIGAVSVVVLYFRLRTEVNEGLMRTGRRVRRRTVTAALCCVAGAGLLAGWLLWPFGAGAMTSERLDAIRAEVRQRSDALSTEYAGILASIDSIRRTDDQFRVKFVDLSGARFAPARQTEPDEPMRISQVVRAVAANDISWFGKVGVYASRWAEFLFGQPRETNTEGGVWPVIFGTVMLTLLLSVAVVPLGVVAAIYLREYARPGPVTSTIRIAVNNLAGVPSIVYGVFGLGFFCYTLGVFIDRGPGTVFGVTSPATWWGGVTACAAVVLCAVMMATLAIPRPATHATRSEKWFGRLATAAWFLAAAGAVWLIATTPYFGGFFAAKESATFGTRGMLWSALTLALLTLPVVIVATEEAVAAVPRTMREGSYGCGASKWQTIQRIVLPRAMPGIMTGMILAMARGAGEVAPLMLTGAVKLAPDLPVSSQFPFLHLERSFMHLGFHIYDVGFQSPDSEAARPLVWCTTLLLIVVVVILNLTAIRIRSRLRRKFLGEAF